MKQNITAILVLFLVLFTLDANAQSGKYKYETVEGDPLKTKIYTLQNGLKVYMSVYKDAPRIQTFVAVKTGSRNDPADATGLAHYLEHMMFKGTSKIGSLDWEKEKVLLQQISDLYEANRVAQDHERPAIFEQIDSLSFEAAKYVAPNEYDKMVSSLGAKGTNAYTWVDQTVYVNDIPSNALNKWLEMEAERFSELVLRLFHTELEAVYEEFNISQNATFRKVNKALLEGLYPQHPYGQQTTIGKGEHLKKPSMEKIHEYFKTYYVPNNMAIILAGDFDPDEVVPMVEKHFGSYQRKSVPQWVNPKQPEIKVPVEQEVFSKESPTITMAWRLEGAGSKDALVAELMDLIVANGSAGLIDLNLVKKQRTGAQTYSYFNEAYDYSFYCMAGQPKTGQSLEQVKKLLLGQLAIVKEGTFPDWLIDAVINDQEYKEIKQMESNYGRANKMLMAFLYDREWKDIVAHYRKMRALTKEDIVHFANEKLKDSKCVIVYKREGKPGDIFEVEKPKITPLELNRETVSDFKKKWDAISTPSLEPVFLDFDQQIASKKLSNNIQLDHITNPYNKTFSLNYIVNMGAEHDKLLPIAVRYLPFLGTNKYTSAELQEEFFKLGVSFDVYAANDVAYVTLTGLESSLEKGVKLFEHILANAQGDENALKNMIAAIKKQRADQKKQKGAILYNAMYSYGKYGKNSPLMDRLSEKALDEIKAEDLVEKIHSLTAYEHDVFYYGTKTIDQIATILDAHHEVPKTLKPIPTKREYIEVDTDEDKVIFVSFPDMTQAEIMMLSKGTKQFDLEESVDSRLFNEYFGGGLSSVVFQEIRESRALAYSAYASNGAPAQQNKPHYFRAFVGTQVDKMEQAIPAMKDIIENMPVSENLMQGAAEAIVKKIESERITKSGIYWTYRRNKKKGLKHDARKDVYDKVSALVNDKKAVVAALKKFQAEKIKGRKYTYLVLGDKDKVDMKFLKTLGKVEEFTIDEIFGDQKTKGKL
ncbi:M16 family metallopeptidase [Aureispira anguillae]|uniref:Insulinase family protein n=1 Tax=Aureispira anguillae TaxID=2864201 RepID=A0A915YC77_9BACT|nr:M16 family metallopeptidase [Aureispira anguillae]BDS10410.1 insulinase family protein [Aureispira anguillae]